MKIICEIGSNWKSFEDCKNAIALAKACGASAIKYQLYTHQELYGMPGSMAGELPRDWIPKLADKAKAESIEFMCTAFSVDGLRFIDPYVRTHKLASSEMCHVDMLAFLKDSGKDLIISTGAQSITDVTAVAAVVGPKATFLYCEASYPAMHVDFRKMLHLKTLIPNPIGYSDHTLDTYVAPMAARGNGATVLEKHFNPFHYADTPDAPHSLGRDDFKAMCKALKNEDAVSFGPTTDELPMLLRHKRRLLAIKPIKKGDRLIYNDNFGAYRSLKDDAKGAHPCHAHMANDKRSKVDLAIGDGLGPFDYGI